MIKQKIIPILITITLVAGTAIGISLLKSSASPVPVQTESGRKVVSVAKLASAYKGQSTGSGEDGTSVYIINNKQITFYDRKGCGYLTNGKIPSDSASFVDNYGKTFIWPTSFAPESDNDYLIPVNFIEMFAGITPTGDAYTPTEITPITPATSTTTKPDDIVVIDKPIATVPVPDNPKPVPVQNPDTIDISTEDGFNAFIESIIEVKGQGYGWYFDNIWTNSWTYTKDGINYGFIVYDGNSYLLKVHGSTTEFANTCKQTLNKILPTGGDTVYYAAEKPGNQEFVIDGKKVKIYDYGKSGSEIYIFN